MYVYILNYFNLIIFFILMPKWQHYTEKKVGTFEEEMVHFEETFFI